jgi:hypothetical protein
LVIVAVVAVVVIAVIVFSLRRKAAPAELPESPAAVTPTPAPEAPREPAPVAAPEPPARPPAKAPPVDAAKAAPPPTPAEEGAEPVEAEARPVDAAAVRAGVEAQLQDSERMLSELRQAAGQAEGPAQQGALSTLDIVAEGLQEVRALLGKKDWNQARDKGQALHAQVSLLLQTVRREQAS